MKLDLSCPVELWHARMPTQEYPVLTLQLFNLSEKTVTSIQAAFLCYSQTGERLSRQVERVQGLSGDSRSSFEMSVAVEDGLLAANIDFIMEKVWFIDGTVWRRGQADSSDYEDNRLQPGKQLDVLRYLAGKDAMGYPSDQGAVWVCVCGRPNPASLATCARCRRDKHEVFTSWNKAAIERIIFERENALEEKARHAREAAGRMQSLREEKELKRRRRRRRITLSISALVLLAGGAYGVYFHGIPAYRYYRANQLLAQRDYPGAKAIYLSLADYAQSADLALESDYLRAGEAAAAANQTSLKAAQDLYESLLDYKDSAARARQMVLERAILLGQDGQYEQAIALFKQIPGYEQADALITKTTYDWAKSLMDNFAYSEAREKFLTLATYQDSAKLAEDCLYKPALAHLEKGEFEQAEVLLTQMADQTLALPKLQDTYYRWGDQLFALTQYEAASEKYLLAGDYLDSSLKAANCLYEPAKGLMAAGDWAAAREKLLKIPGFQDASALAAACLYHLGLEAVKAGDYPAAIANFEGAAGVPEAADALKEAAYLQGRQLQEAGDLQGAVALFVKAADFSDAPALVQALRFQQALDAANKKDYDRAILLFTLLEDYQGSAEELRRAQYNRAIVSLEQGRYEEAILDLSQLKDYQSSAERLKEAQALKGQRAFGQGAYEEAALAYQAAGDYPGAGEGYQASLYAQAQAKLQAGDAAAATPLLKQIPGYKDATELLQSTAYKLAGDLSAAGDYRQAAEQFLLIKDYQDAAAQAAANYDAYYAAAYKTAAEAVKKKDYLSAIQALEPLDRENPDKKYKNLDAMYEKAVYDYANQLYNAGEPYQALPYYRSIPGYKDVTRSKLTRVAYRILGTWETEKGFRMTFREDGTCTIDGREYLFYARPYQLAVGDRRDELSDTYNILAISDDQLNMRRDKPRTLYKLTKAAP
ncbi:MAG: hypothetical protein AB9880_07160 [Christensenellales bacterium]